MGGKSSEFNLMDTRRFNLLDSICSHMLGTRSVWSRHTTRVFNEFHSKAEFHSLMKFSVFGNKLNLIWKNLLESNVRLNFGQRKLLL